MEQPRFLQIHHPLTPSRQTGQPFETKKQYLKIPPIRPKFRKNKNSELTVPQIVPKKSIEFGNNKKRSHTYHVFLRIDRLCQVSYILIKYLFFLKKITNSFRPFSLIAANRPPRASASKSPALTNLPGTKNWCISSEMPYPKQNRTVAQAANKGCRCRQDGGKA